MDDPDLFVHRNGGKASAQAPVSTKEPSGQTTLNTSNSYSKKSNLLTSLPQKSSLTLGQPGLSFRYVKTFGVTGEPYPADTAHLNRPYGITVDGADNLYVAENNGDRVLKYDSSGANTLALGYAGISFQHADFLGDARPHDPIFIRLRKHTLCRGIQQRCHGEPVMEKHGWIQLDEGRFRRIRE
jgi:hypothetical protein